MTRSAPAPNASSGPSTDEFVRLRRESTTRALERAVGRGEIESGFEGEWICDLLTGPLLMRAFLPTGPIDENLARQTVDAALAALAASAQESRHPGSGASSASALPAGKMYNTCITSGVSPTLRPMCTRWGPLGSKMLEPVGYTPSTEQSAALCVSVPDLMTPYSRPVCQCHPVVPPGAMVISRNT